MRKLSVIAAALGLIGALLAAPAQAITLSVEPSAVTGVMIGDTFDVDIVVSDLAGEIVSAFDLNLSYDPGVVTATGAAFGSLLGDPDPGAFETFTDAVLDPGNVNLAQLSLLSDADLAAMQPDSFALATISFEVTGPGSTRLEFTGGAIGFIDLKGRNALVLDVLPEGGLVSPIPEPTSGLLFALGALLVGAAVRRPV